MWWWSSPTADNTLITPLPKTYFIALHNNNWSDCILCFNTVCPISGFLRGSMKFYFFFSRGGAGVLQVNPTHTSLPLRSKIITRFFHNSISIYPGERTWLTLFFSLTRRLSSCCLPCLEASWANHSWVCWLHCFLDLEIGPTFCFISKKHFGLG